jgi:hypothetical protein
MPAAFLEISDDIRWMMASGIENMFSLDGNPFVIMSRIQVIHDDRRQKKESTVSRCAADKRAFFMIRTQHKSL